MRWVLVLVGIAAFGCKDRCDPSYCDGNVAHVCVDEHDNEDYWKEVDCEDKTCVEAETKAFCSAEAEPRAACEGVGLFQQACDASELIRCGYGGYATILEDCGGADLCEASAGCLVHPGVDAECMVRVPLEGSPASYCSGSTRIECEGDFAVMATDCPAGTCRASTDEAACVLTTTPDAACNRTSGWRYQVCRGNVIVTCIDTFPTHEFECPGTCVRTGSTATCGSS